jgi:hypothetical protein
MEDSRREVQESEESHIYGLFRNQFVHILSLEVCINDFEDLLMHHISNGLSYAQHHVQDKIPVIMAHMNLRFGTVIRDRFWDVTHYVLLGQCLGLAFPASSLYKGLNFIHRPKISSVLAYQDVANKIDLHIVHKCEISFLFLYLGLL